jgi:alpha-methylacyl-CoA racemase
VLDLSSVGPASRCTRLLADYGSAVIKIGPVPGRGVTAGAAGEPPFFSYSAHRGMRRALLDLKTDGGRDAFTALVRRADVVVESFRPGVMERLGLGYERLAAAQPALVYCATTGFGPTGRRSTWAAHDLDYLAIGGFLATTGRRGDGAPPVPGATVADAAAGGMQAALAVTTALFERSRTGHGRRLDVSVADGVLWLMSLAIDEYLATGALPGPGHDVLTGRYACYDTYRAADGRWLAVGAIEQKFFANLCRALGCPQWAAHQYDDDRQGELRRALADAFATKSRDGWVEELSETDTCVAPVLEVAEVGEDPDFGERRCIVEAEHPRLGRFRQVGAVLAGMAELEDPVMVPDTSQTDTEALLLEAGTAQEQLASWRKEGAVA